MTLQLLAVLPFPQLLLGDDAEKLLVTGATLAGLAGTVWSDAWLTTHGLPLWQHQYCRYSAAAGVQRVVNQTSSVKAVLSAQCSIYPDVVLLAVQQRKTATQRSGSAASPPLRWIRAGLQLPSDVSLLPTPGSDSTVPTVVSKGQRMSLVTEPCLLPGSSSCRPVATASTEIAETKLLLELHPHDGRSALAMVTASGQHIVILSPSLDILGHSTLPLQPADGAADIAVISGLAWLPAGGLALIDSAGILTVLDAQSYRPCMLHVSLKVRYSLQEIN
ncbi:hypothetical protein QJQ45_014246 [Haematococcus lacustris]|nr:hypothetical protein QJQ45_014246 [Haematococcus lacustris]